MKLKLEPVEACGTPTGDVAYMRMPIKLLALATMDDFVEQAYGKGCTCSEEPKGWLKVSTPKEEKEEPVPNRHERIWSYCSHCGEYSLAGDMITENDCPKCGVSGFMGEYVSTVQKERGEG